MKRHLAFFIVCELFKHCFGKLPPTPPPCNTKDLKAVQECRKTTSTNLMKTIPLNIHDFLVGIQIRSLSFICKSAKDYYTCLDVIHMKSCAYSPHDLWSHSSSESVFNMCEHRYLYESYPSLTDCVKRNRHQFLQCYHQNDGIIKRSHCRTLSEFNHYCDKVNLVDLCVRDQVKALCNAGDSVELASLLTLATIPNSYECGQLKRYGRHVQNYTKISEEDFKFLCPSCGVNNMRPIFTVILLFYWKLIIISLCAA